MTNMIGQSIGRYHILEQLGEGGMATVYKAYDTRLETDVAVKVIRTENLPQSGVEKALKRFEREAKALAKLTHPNIVPIIDYGEYEGSPYLVMKYLPGGTLKNTLKGQPLPWQVAAALLIPVARALDYAHRQGMIHRDVKPSNILITADGQPMLTDFGIAKVIDQDITADLTGTSATVGTPEYMAPEQVVSKTVDQRADIYALGIVFYEMLTGRRPFEADTPMAVLFKHASEALPRPRQFVPGLPEIVEKVLFKALAKKPEDRYQSMQEFAGALEVLVHEQSPVERTVKVSLKRPSTIAANAGESAFLQPERKLPSSPETATIVSPEITAPASAQKKRFPQAWLLVGLIPVIAVLGWFAWQLAGQNPLKNGSAPVGNIPTTFMPVTNSPKPVISPTDTLLPATPEPDLPIPDVCKDNQNECAVFSSGQSVKIGMGAPMTGDNAAFGQDISQAARIAFSDAGKFKGFAFELVAEDDGGTPEGGAAVANKFVSDPQVVAIEGHIFSGATKAAMPIYEAANIPMMSPSATNPPLTQSGSKVFNRCVFTDAAQGKFAATYLYDKLGIKKLAIVHDGQSYGQGLAQVVNDIFSNLGGTVVTLQAITPGESDYSAVLADIASKRPNALFFGGYTAEGVVIVNQMKQSGLEGVIFFGDDGTFGQDFLDRTGVNGEGAYSTSLIPPASDAKAKFDAAYLAAYGQPAGKLSPYTWTGYDAAAVLIKAIQSVAIVNGGKLYIPRAALVAAVRATRDYQGLSGTLTCDATGECSASGPVFNINQGGKWVEAP
jgi:branched-chain amino acid transport system substrate-binding protein